MSANEFNNHDHLERESNDTNENPPQVGERETGHNEAPGGRSDENNKSGGDGKQGDNGHASLTVEELFQAVIQNKLGFAPEEIIADGEINRFGEDDDHNGPCWYVLHADEPAPCGSFGDWRTGEKHHWRGQQTRPLTKEERAEQDKRRAERNSEHLKLQRAAAKKAQKLQEQWERYQVNANFPYLAKKNVGVHGPMFQPEEHKIAIPVRESGDKTVSLQYIMATGGKNKWFMEHGKIGGCYFIISTPHDAPDSPIVICEGYATGATIYETTGFPVIVAFNAGNLEAAAKNVAKKYPGRSIVIAGDDDLKTEKKNDKNTGVVKANEAAKAVNGVAVFPPFHREKDGIEPSDWNDLAALRGKENVGAIFREAIEQAKKHPQSELDDDDRREEVPPPGADEIPPPDEVPPNNEADKKRYGDFIAYLPSHNYIFIPTREHWPAGGVNACLPPVEVGTKNGKPIFISAATWIDRNNPVDQMAWVPGYPMMIFERLLMSGGWIEKKGAKCFNSYMPPVIESGDAAKAGRWTDLMRKLYPNEGDHIIAYLAFKVQRPHVKINHALILGGPPGIGKDTLLEPVKHGVGPWNFQEISPTVIGGTFDGYKRSVILRISEAHDLGEMNRYEFYEHMKTLSAAPPDVLRVNEKHTKEFYVLNCCGIIITTNYKADGMYMPADDRRNLFAWSDVVKEDFSENFWPDFWHWYEKEDGLAHVVAYLREYDLSGFDPKKPPPKTEAFWAVVDANRAPELGELTDLIEGMGAPDAFTLKQLTSHRPGFNDTGDFRAIQEWLEDQKNRRTIPHRLEKCGYAPVRNDAAKDGLWKVGGARQVIYAKHELSIHGRLAAAQALVKKVSDDAAAKKEANAAAMERWRREQGAG